MVTDLVGICFFVGEWVACSVGANFTPHIITVNTGEVNVDHSRCRLYFNWILCVHHWERGLKDWISFWVLVFPDITFDLGKG